MRERIKERIKENKISIQQWYNYLFVYLLYIMIIYELSKNNKKNIF
jgi:hypothetical protein